MKSYCDMNTCPFCIIDIREKVVDKEKEITRTEIYCKNEQLCNYLSKRIEDKNG